MSLPADRIRSIRNGRLAMPLTSRQEQVVVGVACGLKNTEIGELTGLSHVTVGRHVNLIAQRIFSGSDTHPGRESLIIWAYLHQECCLKDAWRRLETGELFKDRGDARHGKRNTLFARSSHPGQRKQ